MGKDGKNARRITTTFTVEQREALERISKANKVEIAWLIKRAVDDLIEKAEGGPLLPFK
ncbi:MAG: ribbon-helix-helix domain-containing protein [Magnetospirillum sp. WYHS-4]